MAQKQNSRKRCNAPVLSLSSVSSAPAESNTRLQKKKTQAIVVNDSDEDEEPIESTTPGNTQPTILQELTDKQELKKACQVHQDQQSDCYAYTHPPQLSNHLDKHKGRMMAYPCQTCGGQIHQPMYNTSPSNLQKHVANCTKKTDDSKVQTLTSLGITGSSDMDARDVPQLCAVWCAEGAHLFLALGEQAHLGILHAVVVQHLPTQKAVSNDIGRLYTAMQEALIEALKTHTGAMYLGLDAWQSPNRFDVLGTMIYCLVKDKNLGFHLEAMPLDFVRLQKSHTGVYLAELVQSIVEKFGLKNKVCGIVTDNTSNNQTMLEEIQSFKWPQFKVSLAKQDDSNNDPDDADDADQQIQL
ncbi:hypothetical protein PSTG_04978 [Puccinia striiformis f. sp. tritici PST-78]|uniref:DUF659 domain-containing protein n=1 Tax=Puccinia striiformis f. sp. tritici PST-78 TaxID=1165861 RepID=A0A0L0VRG2_9BASI|nr:hypothetical protein PSTG_04978 [Puccinia striiformis f. sp. tritici PST-78]